MKTLLTTQRRRRDREAFPGVRQHREDQISSMKGRNDNRNSISTGSWGGWGQFVSVEGKEEKRVETSIEGRWIFNQIVFSWSVI